MVILRVDLTHLKPGLDVLIHCKMGTFEAVAGDGGGIIEPTRSRSTHQLKALTLCLARLVENEQRSNETSSHSA
jgi:hypothetical protein